MLCPICKSILVVTGQEYLETLEEHVCDPNGPISLKDKYQCSNTACIAHADDLVWNYNGEFYSGKNWGKTYPFIDNNNGPFSSITRKINAQQDRRGEFTMLYLWIIKFRVMWKKQADEDGNILSRKPYIQILTRRPKDITWTYYTSGISMFLYCIKQFKKLMKQYDKEKKGWIYKEMQHYMKRDPWDKRWWVKLSAFILNKMYFKKYSLKEI